MRTKSQSTLVRINRR